MLVSRPYDPSKVCCKPIYQFADHESNGYIVQSSYLGNDSVLLAGSHSNRVGLVH